MPSDRWMFLACKYAILHCCYITDFVPITSTPICILFFQLSKRQREIDAKQQRFILCNLSNPKLSQACNNIHVQLKKGNRMFSWLEYSCKRDILVLRATHDSIIACCWLWWSCPKSETLRNTWSRGRKYRRSRSIVEHRDLRLAIIINLRETKPKCWRIVDVHRRHHPFSWSKYSPLKRLQLLVELCGKKEQNKECK